MEKDSDSDSGIPRKCSRTGPIKRMHHLWWTCSTEQFYHPKNEDSWTKLLEEATLRQFEKLLQYKDHPGVPDIYYHSECRKTFCHKKSLTKVKKEQNFSCLGDESKEHSQRRSREKPESSDRVYAEVCIFCDRKAKYLKGINNREKLTQSVDLRADTTIRDAAIRKGDTKIMAIAVRELVAAEAHYHIPCYKKYTVPETTVSPPRVKSSSHNTDSKQR